MSDEKLINDIGRMSSWELLEWIMHNPTDLTDPYYSKFGDAISKRYEELKEIRAA